MAEKSNKFLNCVYQINFQKLLPKPILRLYAVCCTWKDARTDKRTPVARWQSPLAQLSLYWELVPSRGVFAESNFECFCFDFLTFEKLWPSEGKNLEFVNFSWNWLLLNFQKMKNGFGSCWETFHCLWQR